MLLSLSQLLLLVLLLLPFLMPLSRVVLQNLSDSNVNLSFKLLLLKKNGEPFEEKISEQVLVANGSRGWRR
jgi:hypothetical protein